MGMIKRSRERNDHATTKSISIRTEKVSAFIGAMIATLLGLPWIMALVDPYLFALVKKLYPELHLLIYWVIHGGIYVMFFTLLQSLFYLAITSAVAALAAHAFRFAL